MKLVFFYVYAVEIYIGMTVSSSGHFSTKKYICGTTIKTPLFICHSNYLL